MSTPSSRSRSSQKRKQQHRRRLSSTRAGGVSVCACCVFFDAKNSDARRLIKSWNRPELRRPIRQIDHRLLDKTPAPAFRRIIASDDRMCAGRVMPGRMPARRLIATADMAAGSTHTQMKPFRTGLDALLATAGARCDLLNRGGVTAVSAHPAHPFSGSESSGWRRPSGRLRRPRTQPAWSSRRARRRSRIPPARSRQRCSLARAPRIAIPHVTGAHKTVRTKRDRTIPQPVGIRIGAEEQRQMT